MRGGAEGGGHQRRQPRTPEPQGPSLPPLQAPRPFTLSPRPPTSPPAHLSGPQRPKPSFQTGGGSGGPQGAPQVGLGGASRVRLGRDLPPGLRCSPIAARSWRESRPRARSRSRSGSRRAAPLRSSRRCPAPSRGRSGRRSRSARGGRPGSRSLGRARDSRGPDAPSMPDPTHSPKFKRTERKRTCAHAHSLSRRERSPGWAPRRQGAL